MLIKGEKWACEACVRGHRVSNCQHSDRPLQHINKKGRPVSQCQHCRSLRKSRSAHVRCDCGGEKAHPKGASGQESSESLAENCCYSHSTRCSCALKKEHLDPVPESDSDEPILPPVVGKRRSRAHTTNSDFGLTTFTNGHHKPVHKNNMAHKRGLPYVVPRGHSIHGPSPSGLANRSVDNLPHISTIEALHGESLIKDSMVSAHQEQRMAKSEHGSPLIACNEDIFNGQPPPLDISFTGDCWSLGFDGISSVQDPEPHMVSASTTSIDWSHYDGLDFNNDNFAASYSQAPSFTGFEFSSIDQPALTTTSTSDEISEVEDLMLNERANSRPNLFRQQQQGSDFDASELGGDIDGYRLSTASSYIGLPQSQILNVNNNKLDDLEAYLKGSGNFSHVSSGLSTYVEEISNPSQDSSPYTDSNFAISCEKEGKTLWMNAYSPGSIAISTGRAHSDLAEENFWAQ